MNNTEQFVSDAIAGGWKPQDFEGAVAVWNYEDGLLKVSGTFRKTQSVREYTIIEQILLDSLAWQAVGKTRGWDVVTMFSYVTGKECPKEYEWIFKMHRFIDHLADGKSVEDALTAI